MFDQHKKNDHRGDDLSTEVVQLWKMMADLQGKLAELHKDRGIDRAMRGATIDAKAIN